MIRRQLIIWLINISQNTLAKLRKNGCCPFWKNCSGANRNLSGLSGRARKISEICRKAPRSCDYTLWCITFFQEYQVAKWGQNLSTCKFLDLLKIRTEWISVTRQGYNYWKKISLMVTNDSRAFNCVWLQNFMNLSI